MRDRLEAVELESPAPVWPVPSPSSFPSSAGNPESASSSPDPRAWRFEELLWKLRGDYTILIVTHNMAQARRASEECVFMLLGKVVEHGKTEDIFVTPDQQETADYIEGRYG